MRVRSVVLVLSMSALLAGAILRCSPPPLPPGPQAVPTRVGFLRGAILSLPPGGAIDRPALVASLKEAKLNTVILGASGQDAESVNGQVSLAIELQRELDADVYLSTDRAGQLVDALHAATASERIGCFITGGPELADTSVPEEDRATRSAALRDAAGPCIADRRRAALSSVLGRHPGDPGRAGVLLRELLRDTGISIVLLGDGVGTVDPAQPRRAAAYYQGLRNALADRLPLMEIWAKVEAFDCVDPSCAKTHPTTSTRFIEQLCGARARVDGIVGLEYLHDLAERPLLDASSDSDSAPSADLQAIFDDSDASAQLRKGYLDWREAGAPCP